MRGSFSCGTNGKVFSLDFLANFAEFCLKSVDLGLLGSNHVIQGVDQPILVFSPDLKFGQSVF